MLSLNYYLELAQKGDANAAFQAARLMYYNDSSEVIVQAQMRRAARLGSVDAMRWLGIMGLTHRLVHPDSTVSHVMYYDTYDVSFDYFQKAAVAGDGLSALVVCKCLQHGIGTEKDSERAERLLNEVVPNVSENSILPIMCLFDIIKQHKSSQTATSEVLKIRDLLAS